MLARVVIASILGLFAAAASAVTHEIELQNFSFTPSNLTIRAGDTVIWRNTAGAHNVAADDGSFRSGPVFNAPWTFERVFNTPGTFGYYCEPHGGRNGVGMSGRITVQAAQTTFSINEGIQGSWFNPATSGQGFLLEVSPSAGNIFSMAWFTWAGGTAGQYDWLTGAGTYNGPRATINLFRTRGGRFNDPTAVTTTPAGTATFDFTSCTAGSVTFTLTDPAASGTIPIQRILPASAICTGANP